MGVMECDNMLMILGVSEQLNRKQRDIVTPLVIQGFGGVYMYVYVSTCGIYI